MGRAMVIIEGATYVVNLPPTELLALFAGVILSYL